jgi:acetyl esterase/lipase
MEELPPEANITTPDHRTIDGRPAIRMSNVVDPTITVFRPNPSNNTGVAVIVCPGGGYNYAVVDLEGSEVCEWLNSIGVTGIVLKYRTPAREGLPRGFAPLQDAQRAMGLVRQHAAEWEIDSDRTGILGFSAGGHLAANLSNNHDERSYPRIDAADALSCRPDFAVLLYPGYLVDAENGNTLSPELTVGAGKTPPTFLAMTQDDPVRVENAVFYYLALHGANVPAELHLYPTGGHGYGLRPAPGDSDTWPLRMADWMESSGWLLTE